ncbi:hypothetical protein [Psychroserpens ponticola]|uniref:Uncharacterized protein n=1 Tax=Psychroserpens ponticola TaxID=2932268 RepID=A0ABY7RSY8_9FLAO|nr:hypothetical protein [Psychroserpens ponticola]WCO00224.1 hypothetical protein MUN68_009065 [Psychroserpens ponticola]
MITEIIEKASHWINNQNFEQEMIVLEEGIEKHNHCFLLSWCKKSEKELNWEQKTSWVGIGRILISKDGNTAEFEGSSPGVDWVHHFELKLQNLEDYWSLEIPYSKGNISKLKSILNRSTPELLKMVNNNEKIILTESKAWCDNYTELEEIANNLNNVGIHCELEVKTRKNSC